ncbi:MAG TPA: ketoacyl-ACP synthase III [Terriglobales bacterium]|nr:ketoacyl-ACP synthase III [Terriglobales bacterium]
MRAFITGSGAFLPERIVPNEEIAHKLGLTPEQIFESSGIRRRRWAAPGTKASTLACTALRCAIANANLLPEQMDFLLLGTMTPDRFIPGTAPAVQKQLEIPPLPCLDIHATCCNAIYGLQLARSMVVAGTAKNVAVCFADVQSAWLDISAEAGTTSMLFGDGGSAFIVSGHEHKGSLQVLDVLLRTDGTFVDDLGIRCPGTEFGNRLNENYAQRADFLPRMNGQRVLMRASRNMAAVCRTLLQQHELTAQEIAWIVPHQANFNVMRQLMRALGLSRHMERLVSVIEDYGNTSSASMGIALDALRRSGRVRRGDYVLMPAFGAGFTWGAALCRAV